MDYKKTERQLKQLLKRTSRPADDSALAETWKQIAELSIEMLLNANKQNERLINMLEIHTERTGDYRKENHLLASRLAELNEELAQCNLEMLYVARRTLSDN